MSNLLRASKIIFIQSQLRILSIHSIVNHNSAFAVGLSLSKNDCMKPVYVVTIGEGRESDLEPYVSLTVRAYRRIHSMVFNRTEAEYFA